MHADITRAYAHGRIMVGSGQRITLPAVTARACACTAFRGDNQFSIYPAQHNSLCAQEVRQWHALATSMPPGECELLYGRAGYLYCLLYLCKHVSPEAADASMVRTTPMHCAFRAAHPSSCLLQLRLVQG